MVPKAEVSADYRSRQAAKLWSSSHRPGLFSLVRMGQNIDRALAVKGWTQAELARQSGVQSSVISNIRLLKREPGIAIAWSLALALGVTIDELCNGQEPKEGKDDENE